MKTHGRLLKNVQGPKSKVLDPKVKAKGSEKVIRLKSGKSHLPQQLTNNTTLNL
jgi:hypothetical protein